MAPVEQYRLHTALVNLNKIQSVPFFTHAIVNLPLVLGPLYFVILIALCTFWTLLPRVLDVLDPEPGYGKLFLIDLKCVGDSLTC